MNTLVYLADKMIRSFTIIAKGTISYKKGRTFECIHTHENRKWFYLQTVGTNHYERLSKKIHNSVTKHYYPEANTLCTVR